MPFFNQKDNNEPLVEIGMPLLFYLRDVIIPFTNKHESVTQQQFEGAINGFKAGMQAIENHRNKTIYARLLCCLSKIGLKIFLIN